jgi:hypothetical protein
MMMDEGSLSKVRLPGLGLETTSSSPGFCGCRCRSTFLLEPAQLPKFSFLICPCAVVLLLLRPRRPDWNFHQFESLQPIHPLFLSAWLRGSFSMSLLIASSLASALPLRTATQASALPYPATTLNAYKLRRLHHLVRELHHTLTLVELKLDNNQRLVPPPPPRQRLDRVQPPPGKADPRQHPVFCLFLQS